MGYRVKNGRNTDSWQLDDRAELRQRHREAHRIGRCEDIDLGLVRNAVAEALARAEFRCRLSRMSSRAVGRHARSMVAHKAVGRTHSVVAMYHTDNRENTFGKTVGLVRETGWRREPHDRVGEIFLAFHHRIDIESDRLAAHRATERGDDFAFLLVELREQILN